MFFWSTTTVIMGTLQTRPLLMMSPRRVRPSATVMSIQIFWMGRQKRRFKMCKIWQEQCYFMLKQDGQMLFTYTFGHSNENGCTHHESSTRWGRWHFPYWKIFMSRNASKDATFSHFWMSSICINTRDWKCQSKEMGCKVKVGLYLGPSPMHAGLVSLALSLETWIASPRSSVLHDDFIETTRYNLCSTQTKSMWQLLSWLD